MPKKTLFSRIETRAVMKDGRVITSWRSYPMGATKADYDAINNATVKAFGVHTTRIVGTFMEENT